MYSNQQRTRRLAAARRLLEEFNVEKHQSIDHESLLTSLECAGRPHLIGAGTWMIASYLRAMERSAIPKPSDNLPASLPGGKSSRNANK